MKSIVSYTAKELLWLIFVILAVAVAVTAIVFAVLAWIESQGARPHRNMVRHDIIAKGDLVVDGNAKTDNLDAESLQVHKGASLARLKVCSLRLHDVVTITDKGTSTVPLSVHNSGYRVDSPAGSIVNLILPAVADAPGQLFQISKSKLGAEAEVNVLIGSSDFLCDHSGCQPGSVMPMLTLMANESDQLWLSNDGVSAWKPL